jgi:hypothetical protein
MTEIPEGWTDDMSIVLPSGITLDKVVDVVLRSEANKEAHETIVAELVKMGLTEDDALLAHDRALGGLVRAATRNPMNAPPQDKDPIAWTSYQHCLRGPAMIAAIRPQYVRSSDPAPVLETPRWWQFWKRR